MNIITWKVEWRVAQLHRKKCKPGAVKITPELDGSAKGNAAFHGFWCPSRSLTDSSQQVSDYLS